MDLRVDDSSSFFPALRAGWTLLPQEPSRFDEPLFAADSELRGGTGLPMAAGDRPAVHAFAPTFGLDLHVGQADGSDSQTLQTNDFFSFGNDRIDGPVTLDVDYRLQRAALSARGGFRIRDRFAVEVLLGVSAAEAKAQLESATFDDTSHVSGTGGLVGAELSLRLVDSWTIYTRGDFSTVGSDADLTTFEIGMRALQLGGPTVGLQFAF